MSPGRTSLTKSMSYAKRSEIAAITSLVAAGGDHRFGEAPLDRPRHAPEAALGEDLDPAPGEARLGVAHHLVALGRAALELHPMEPAHPRELDRNLVLGPEIADVEHGAEGLDPGLDGGAGEAGERGEGPREGAALADHLLAAADDHRREYFGLEEAELPHDAALALFPPALLHCLEPETAPEADAEGDRQGKEQDPVPYLRLTRACRQRYSLIASKSAVSRSRVLTAGSSSTASQSAASYFPDLRTRLDPEDVHDVAAIESERGRESGDAIAEQIARSATRAPAGPRVPRAGGPRRGRRPSARRTDRRDAPRRPGG